MTTLRKIGGFAVQNEVTETNKLRISCVIPIRRYRPKTPEERLERLLDEAERDICAGSVSDARAGLAAIRDRNGLRSPPARLGRRRPA